MIAIIAILVVCALFCTVVSAASVKVPSGWVRIPSKGKTFTMGQEFTGKRWTYTFPAHPVTFTYDFMMSATQVTQEDYLKQTGVNPTKHPGDL